MENKPTPTYQLDLMVHTRKVGLGVGLCGIWGWVGVGQGWGSWWVWGRGGARCGCGAGVGCGAGEGVWGLAASQEPGRPAAASAATHHQPRGGATLLTILDNLLTQVLIL